MKAIRKSLQFAAVALVATVALSACGGTASPTTTSPAAPAATQTPDETPAGFVAPGDDEKGGKNNPVKIGVVGESGPQWATFQKLAEDEGIYTELVDFSDYQQPNPQLDAGQLDLNQFQHILFQALYNNESGSNLAAIGSTAIYPLGLYSQDYSSVEEIPEGSQIAVPNDGTNQARALGVLQSAGLIVLADGTQPLTATPEDVDESASKVKVFPVAADQTARSLDDNQIAAAVINNDYVADTGLNPQDAIAQDDPEAESSKPFINVWTARDEDKANPVFLKIVEIAQSSEVEADLQENSGGTAVIVHATPEELAGYLADAQAQLQ